MDRIKVGIIGFGRSGCNIHADAISQKKDLFDLVAICDELPELRSHQEFPNATAYAKAEDLIADPEVEMVVVSTYNYTHAKYAIQALDAGKHVLCEKPFGFTTADVDAMIAASKRNNRVLQPFQQRRFASDFEAIQEVLRSGVLGEIGFVRICWPGFGRRWDWQTSRVRGGGQLYNNGPHLIDYGMELFGDSDPVVTSTVRNMLGSGDAEDEIHVMLQGEGAPQVEMIISATCAFPQDRWLICGRNGTLRGTGTELEWKYVDWSKYPERKTDMNPLPGRYFCSEDLAFTTGSWKEEKAGNTDGGAGSNPASAPALKLYDTLYRAIRLGEPQVITPEQIRRRVAVLETCYRQNGIPFPEGTRQ